MLVQPYRSIQPPFPKVATPSSGTAYMGTRICTPYLYHRCCVSQRISAVTLSSLLPIFILFSLSIYIITYFIISCQELFSSFDYLCLEDNHHPSLIFFNYIITYFLFYCQPLFFGSDCPSCETKRRYLRRLIPAHFTRNIYRLLV